MTFPTIDPGYYRVVHDITKTETETKDINVTQRYKDIPPGYVAQAVTCNNSCAKIVTRGR